MIFRRVSLVFSTDWLLFFMCNPLFPTKLTIESILFKIDPEFNFNYTMPKISQHAEYVILSLALCLGVLSTALASPLYPIYVQSWHVSTTEIGYAFVAYMIGVVFTLLFFNQFTNRYGFKKIVCIGLGLCVIALIYSALASNIYHLCSARFLIGISSGLLSTSTMVGLSLKYPFSNPAIAGKVTSILTVFGFSLGPLVGGLIADHTSYPLVMPYVVIMCFSLITLMLCFLINYQHQPPTQYEHSKVWNIPQHPKSKNIFFPCAVAALCGFAVFSLYAALSGNFLATLPIPQSATLTGISISVILFISAFAQFFFKAIDESKSLIIGLILLLLGCYLLIASQSFENFYLLACSILSIGLGHGFTLNPAYYLITRMTKSENPAIFSTFLLIAYQGTIWPVLLSSSLIDYFGIPVALTLFSFIILFSAIWIIYQVKQIELS